MAGVIENAVEEVLSEGIVLSSDFGGSSSTVQVGEAVCEKLNFGSRK